jgi:hypothetical protein
MEILDKKTINDKFGSYGMFSGKGGNALLNEVIYLGGIPSLDSIIEKNKVTSKGIYFEIRPKGLEILMLNGFSTYRFGLYDEGINYWAFEAQKKITEKKSKSIIGRALVGGLILGPVGAIVGGMTGIGDKEKSKSLSGIDNILSISYTENDIEYILLFECSDKKTKKVMEYFNKNFQNKYNEATEEEELSTNNNSVGKSVSIADELLKLKSLLDDGILTLEEFDAQKSKLLNK